MAKNWDYADLSKMASQNGGPQELLKKHAALYMKKGFKEGFEKGAKSKKPVIVVAFAVGQLLGAGVMWTYNKLKQKKEQATISEAADNEEIKKVEAKLVSEMKAAKEAESGEIVEGHKADEPQDNEDAKEEKGHHLR